MASSSKIFALLFIISFLSISAAATTTTPQVDSDGDNPTVTPQFFGFFRLIPKVLPLIPNIVARARPTKIIDVPQPNLPLQPPPVEEQQPDLPLQPPPVEAQQPYLPLQPPPVEAQQPDLPLPPVEAQQPDLPLPPVEAQQPDLPSVEAQLHNNDLRVPVAQQCPIETQKKVGACMDLVGLRRSAMNKCCPIFEGLVEAEAAVCMCTTLKQKAMDVKVFVPIALQVLAKCGKTPPLGYTCDLSL